MARNILRLATATLVVAAIFSILAATASSAVQSIFDAANAAKIQDNSPFIWDHVGGDPFVKGGVNDGNIAAVLNSPRTRACAASEHIPTVVWNTFVKDAQKNVKALHGTMKTNASFDAMAFGTGCKLAGNTWYTGPPVPAFTRSYRFAGVLYTLVLPFGCGNIAVTTERVKFTKAVTPSPIAVAVAYARSNSTSSSQASAQCPAGTVAATAGAGAWAYARAKAIGFGFGDAQRRAYAAAVAKTSTSTSTSVACNSNTPPPTPPSSPMPKSSSPPPPPPPPPVQHSCSLSVGLANKADPNTASASASTDSSASVTVNWGDGAVTGPGSHTYAMQQPGPAGTGITYTISATATFGDGQTVNCGSAQFFVPAPPPNNNDQPPPLP